MKNLPKKLAFIIVVLALIFLAIPYVGFDSPKDVSKGTAKNDSSSAKDLYAESSAFRNGFLVWANENKEYQTVVKATDDGIQNHKALIWDDMDFWVHRGMALYKLGDCDGAKTSFEHVLTRAQKDSVAYDVASGLSVSIVENKTCLATATSSDKID